MTSSVTLLWPNLLILLVISFLTGLASIFMLLHFIARDEDTGCFVTFVLIALGLLIAFLLLQWRW